MKPFDVLGSWGGLGGGEIVRMRAKVSAGVFQIARALVGFTISIWLVKEDH